MDAAQIGFTLLGIAVLLLLILSKKEKAQKEMQRK
jgi:hypothetical protein